MKKICYLFGAGEFYDAAIEKSEEDYVIAVDGGYEYAEQLGLVPDLVIGDFDSLGEMPVHPNLICLPCEKDDTDMLAALKEGLKLGYDCFLIYGGMGGRIDHTLANISCLAYLAEHGARGFLYGKETAMTVISNDTLTFDESFEGYISVFSYTDAACGVTLKGLKYELNAAKLTNTFPIGVSNEFTGRESSVSVQDGKLLIVYTRRSNKG